MTKSPTTKTLTRQDFVNHIATRISPRSEKAFRRIVDKLVECLSDALHAGKTIYLGKPGKMHVKRKDARTGGGMGPIPACIAVTITQAAAADQSNKYLRSDLLADLQSKARLTSREARDVLSAWESFLDLVPTFNYRIEFRGFGSFYPRSFGAITRRNPQTNVTFTAEPKTVTAFKASRLLRKSLEAALLV